MRICKSIFKDHKTTLSKHLFKNQKKMEWDEDEQLQNSIYNY